MYAIVFLPAKAHSPTTTTPGWTTAIPASPPLGAVDHPKTEIITFSWTLHIHLSLRQGHKHIKGSLSLAPTTDIHEHTYPPSQLPFNSLSQLPSKVFREGNTPSPSSSTLLGETNHALHSPSDQTNCAQM